MNSQPTCDCRNAHKHDEDLEGQGITAIGFDVVNSHEQQCGNDANDDDVHDSRHFPPPDEARTLALASGLLNDNVGCISWNLI